jgi:hypothetical protein
LDVRMVASVGHLCSSRDDPDWRPEPKEKSRKRFKLTLG